MKVSELEQFGQPISENMADYLKRHTSANDRANVAINTSMSLSTIRDVLDRKNKLTEANAVGIKELVKIAARNIAESMEESKKALKYFEKQLELRTA